MTVALGHRRWAMAEGCIPGWQQWARARDAEPRTVCLLNTGGREAKVSITLFFSEREPVGPCRATVPARRTRHVRCNDLTDPEPVPLGTDFASVIDLVVPVVAQHTRLDSRQAENALMTSIACPCT